MQLSLFEDEKVEIPLTNVRQKKCGGCGDTFPETADYFNKGYAYHSRDGTKLQHYLNKCRTCQNAGSKAQYTLKKKHGHKAFGTCDCCGVAAKDVKGGKLHLDHCHVTEEYRGHLCGSCNRGLGMLGDNKEGVQQALDYLKRVESKR